jgi:hypothetical protein
MAAVPQTPFLDVSRRELASIALCSLPVIVFFAEFTDAGQGLFALIAVYSIVVSIRFAWPLRRQIWFWITIAAIAALHALALYLFDWSWIDKLGKLSSLVGFADIVAILGSIYAIYVLKYGAPAQTVADIPELPSYAERDLDL